MVRTDFKLTAVDYRALPETGPRYQLIDGDLIRMTPAPSFRHQTVVAALIHELWSFVVAKKLGKVVGSPVDVYLSQYDVVQPDVLFVSNARKKRIIRQGVKGGPDLVVEVLSPSTRTLDLGPKRVLYARHGVTELWIIDLKAETLKIYRLQEKADAPVRTLRPSDDLTTDLLPGLVLPLSRIFVET